MSLITHLLICIFGSGSWVAINGLWVELPQLVPKLPEGWNLPSYIVIICQLANVGPLLITLLHRYRPGYLSEVAVIYAFLAVGTVACIFFAFLWEKTSVVAGVLHSTPFLILTFVLSLVDCTSSVTFFPFMARLPPKYINTLFVGEGLSGLLPALVALIQGSGTKICTQVTNASLTTVPPKITSIPGLLNVTMSPDLVARTPQPENCHISANFSPFVYFLLLSLMMAGCLTSFHCLVRLSKQWKCSTEDHLINHMTLTPFSDKEASGGSRKRGSCSSEAQPEENKGPVLFRAQLTFVYILMAFLNALTNGVFPSIHTYAVLPYGSKAYHLSSVLGSITHPLICFLTMFLPEMSLSWLGVTTLVAIGFGAYNTAMAVLSPCPLLKDTRWGQAIIVISWVLCGGIITYVKVIAGVYLRKVGQSALLWGGAAVQLGSAFGATLMFPLVNVLHLFKTSYEVTHCPS